MAGFKRTVTLTYGFVQALTDLTSSKAPEDKDTKLTQVCTAGGHAPTKPKWDPFCPACNTTVPKGTLAKASEPTKGTFVVMTADEVDDLKGDDEQYKGKLALTSHLWSEVEGSTIPTGTVYYLTPNPKDQFYEVLRQMILDTPDLAYMGRYTVTSRAATYRVRPYGDILVAEQMLEPEMLVAPPSYTPTPIPEAMLEMAREVATKFVTPYDPAAYANTYKVRLAEALGAREASPGAALPATTAATTVADPMAAMLAQMAAMVSAPPANASEPAPVAEKKPAPRKRTTKKAVA